MILENCSLESYGTIFVCQCEERDKKKQERKKRNAERYPQRR